MALADRGRVCVVGAGLFGVTSALLLARDGWSVRLVEEQSSILAGASGNNVFRLHRGYHYPRSALTAISSRESEIYFVAEYGPAVVYSSRHLYAISRTASRTNADKFLEHCRSINLAVTAVDTDLFRRDAVELVVEAVEARIDPRALVRICKQKLRESDVIVECGRTATAEVATDADFLVLANNYGINAVAQCLGIPVTPRQYELCEVAVIDSVAVGDTDVVVMDGDFVSLSPFGRVAGKYLLYDVVHSVHCSEVSTICSVRADGVGEWGPRESSFDAMKATACRFLRGLDSARLHRSLWSVRTVPADVEETDERPTVVEWLSPTVLSVSSGKLGTSVSAARSVVDALRNA